MSSTQQMRLLIVGLASLLLAEPGLRPDTPKPLPDSKARLEIGRELFVREWISGDKRSFAGNGLGPVFNARSCAACHRQGGIGGSGLRGNNATIASVFVDLSGPRMLTGIPPAPPDPSKPVKQPDREQLAAIHPALRNENSFPLHRFSVEQKLEEWKSRHQLSSSGRLLMGLGENGPKIGDVRIALITSERNTPALFGAGLVDRIPESVLTELSVQQAKLGASQKLPSKESTVNEIGNTRIERTRIRLPISGRVARLKDGQVGRFGWKANVASLREFTLQACSSELGLEVPGFHRAPPPWVKNYKAPGLDLSADQCDCLIEFVTSFPRPVMKLAETPQHATEIAAGQMLFESMGCAVCHRPKLGDIDGIYSDLLLHDMGQSLSGSGFYGTNVEFVKKDGETEPLPVNRDALEEPKREIPPKFGAGAREWRTPPLWGLADSAPYLHDGRAETLADAIVAHDGEGAQAAAAFEKLTPRERFQLEMFLQSLVAPEATAR